MSTASAPAWESKRTEESRKVEESLQGSFEKVDAYRYNSASIRVRVIDPRFKGKNAEERDAMVEPYLEKLPENIQADIVNLFTFSPDEIGDPKSSSRYFFMNTEFEDPSPSEL